MYQSKLPNILWYTLKVKGASVSLLLFSVYIFSISLGK